MKILSANMGGLTRQKLGVWDFHLILPWKNGDSSQWIEGTSIIWMTLV
jgi:hypothetical protein